ncbi:MAG TPA: twin-arginine translocation signal domain-containing protein [Terriglobia bacterium]|nr:twin-arginine translocation signal domain-containing protein [Terriglobia bacterium]
MTRRNFLKAASAGAASLSPLAAGITMATPGRKSSDIRVKDIRISYEDFPYRTPYEFGGRSVDKVTLLDVHCTVETVDGHVAKGFGSMTMGNEWAFPSKTLSYDTTLNAMKLLAERISRITGGYKEPGHPIDINFTLEPEYLRAAAEVTKEMHLDQPVPKLCTLVTASAFDAAIHDAFGKVHGLNCYQTYGPEFMSHDLAHYLAPQFKGEYPSQYLLKRPKPWVWCNHSVGASDPIEAADVKKRLNDGLPQTLAEWIAADGLTHLKIKLNGNNLDRDIVRVLLINRVATEVQTRRRVRDWYYTLDFNEQCPNVDYLMEFIHRIREKSPGGYDRILYLEQPESRDLIVNPSQMLFKASKLKPVVMDESLTGYDSLLRGRKLGYTGVALKACKGQSQSMLLNAAAQKFKMYMSAQDLTCPGASLIQSAGIAAHVAPIDTLESNGREYVPAANKPWLKNFPGLFEVRDGKLHTDRLGGLGLSAV